MTRSSRYDWVVRLCAVILVGTLGAGCATMGALKLGDDAALAGDWDLAVEHFRQAVQDDPGDVNARIQFTRAMQQAARVHETRARDFEAQDELPAALAEYRRASGFDPTNGRLMQTVGVLERRIRDLVEAARPPSPIELLQRQARAQNQPPLLDPASDEPRDFQFSDAMLRDILDFLGNATGINVTYDQTFQDRPYTVQMNGVTFEEALAQILTATQNFYKVLNPRSLIIVPDTPQKRGQYEEQVIRTFYISHADVTELATLLTQVVRAPTLAVQPQIVPNTTSNTITVRATLPVADVIERVIASNDKPPAEIVVDIQILEVNRERARRFGLELSQYSIGTVFSPGSAPGDAGAGAFNANVLSQGISPSDFYLSVPGAIINFLETDSETRLIAEPQLRGQEGSLLTLNLGDDIPVPSTSFTAIATGGVAVNPLVSFEYRSVGVNIEMTPRVTYDNEIVLDLSVENSTLGPNLNVAGQDLPTFGSRKVVTRLRLRDGESNLLAGLLREEDRRSLRGFPGILRLPIIRQLFSANDDSIRQTDIVMLLTPRIVRTHQLTEQDVSPIYIGTQQNMGVAGAPPLIAPIVVVEPDPANLQNDAAAALGSTREAPGTSGQPTLDAGDFGAAPVLFPNPVFPEVGQSRPVFLTGVDRPTFGAQVDLAPTGTDVLLDDESYSVPISISGASEVSTLSLSLMFDPSVLRVSSIREGRFMSQGAAAVTFAQEVDASAGRIDLVFARTGDAAGATGDGLLATVVFDTVGHGSATLSPSGLGLTPDGAPLAFNFGVTTISVR